MRPIFVHDFLPFSPRAFKREKRCLCEFDALQVTWHKKYIGNIGR